MAVNLLLNNLVNDSINYISFTNMPNIVTISDDTDYGAQLATYIFTISATTLANADDGTYTIELFGETISSVKRYDNAVNKNFWISSNSNASTAASIAKALRNCPSLEANYLIENYSNNVRLTGRRLFETDIQSNYFIYENGVGSTALANNFKLTSYSDGQDPSPLTNARVSVDIYSGDSETYVTTLEKVCPYTKVSFNISPVITSLAEYGKATKYEYKVSYVRSNGTYVEPYSEDDYINYAVIGGDIWEDKTVKDASLPFIAFNYERGNAWTDVQNHTLLYLYDPVINLSVFRGSNTAFTATYDFLDSAFQSLTDGEGFTVVKPYENNNLLQDIVLDLISGDEPANKWGRAFYVDITMFGVTIRYNVIKPLKDAEGFTRLYWRNSYAGVSFFDFTGKLTESSSIENQLTYKKNLYDYYDTELYSDEEKVYGKEIERTLKLKSHLIEKNAKYLFQDLEKTRLAWVKDKNDKVYEVIINSVAFNETDTNNDLYEAEVEIVYAVKF